MAKRKPNERGDTKPTIVLPDTERFLNCTEIAEAVGRSVWWIYGIKKAGEELNDPAFPGGVTTITELKAWLKRHPSFSASFQHRKPKRASWPRQKS